MHQENARQILKDNYFFTDLSAKVFERIINLVRIRTLKKGEILFQRGDEDHNLYGIINGMMRISTSTGNDKEIILNMLEEGDILGEIAFLDGLPRTADATALEKCTIFSLSRHEFQPLIADEPELAQHIIDLLCERLRWMSEALEDATLLSLPARFAKRLLYLATLYGETQADDSILITLHMSQAELGNLLATSRESVNKMLQTWRKENIIDIEKGRKIRILDKKALETILNAE